MATATKSTKATSDKWARVTPGRTEDYTNGIKNPKRSWASEASASKDNYKAGVDKAHANNSFVKGVTAAGDSKWQKKALAKGPGRFAEGVTDAQSDYEKGIAPFLSAIQATDLGPRFPRGDLRNLDRVKKVTEAVRKVKIGS